MTKAKKVIIAGGGTGGHIYPAIAIGRALQKKDPSVQISFVGTKDGLEGKILARENLPLHLIQSGKLNFSGNPVEKIKTLLKIPVGLVQSFFLILRERPDFVLGVGGYASAPFVLMAALLGRRTAFWEPNAHPGMANRLLSKIVKKSYLVFAESKKYLSSTDNKVFGMPLREEIEKALAEARPQAGEKFNILCFGGSQGSFFLNEKISDFVMGHPGLHDRIQVVHQTGPADFLKTKNKYKDVSCVEVHEFIYDMPARYKKADVQFCRGGASTIAEASAFGVVPLIVPLPAADDHQLKNAQVVERSEAGFLFDQKTFDEKAFAETLKLLMRNRALLNEMSANLKKLAPKEAAGHIADDILKSSPLSK